MMSRAGHALSGHNWPMAAVLPTNLRRILDEKGRSARDVSLKAGFSESFVKHILRETSKGPSYENLQALAAELGVEVGDLVGAGAFIKSGDRDYVLTSRHVLESDAAHIKERIVVPKLDPVPGDPIHDLDEAALLRMWRRLSMVKKATLFAHLGEDDMPSLRKSA